MRNKLKFGKGAPMSFLSSVRCKEKPISTRKQVLHTVAIAFFGIALGTFSKFLDTTPANALPFLFQYLDLTNFLGRFAIWVLLGICISIYSNSAMRASINAFVFFLAMVGSYYLYSKLVAGFFPKSYAMIWFAFTAISPLLAFLCWYAKGKSRVSNVLSAIIIAVLFNMTFIYGWFYFAMRSILELMVFIVGLIILKRDTIKATMVMVASAIVLAVFLDLLIPFHFG